METKNSLKIKLLKLWEILQRDSDDGHPLATNELLEKLRLNGIECDRRTLYSDIDTLNAFGYEVLCKKGQHSNQYYVVDRSFDIPELHILLDAVQAASFITEKKTAEIVDKIAALAGSYRADLLKRNVVQFNTVKHRNESIYYSISNIIDSIIENKKVSFRYFDFNERKERVYRKDGNKYTVNPIATVFSNDNYYFVCYHDNHESITIYRVDRMTDVAECEEPINAEKRPKGFELANHRKQVFSMFSGETQKVQFQIERRLIDAVIDKFGEDITFTHLSEDKVGFTSEIQISPAFFGWCCCFGKSLKIVSPREVSDKLKEYIQEIVKEY